MKWNKMEEVLPPIHTDVIVHDKNGRLFCGRLIIANGELMMADVDSKYLNHRLTSIKYWVRLPELPTEEESQ